MEAIDDLLGCVDLGDSKNLIASCNLYSFPTSYGLVKWVDVNFNAAIICCNLPDDTAKLCTLRVKNLLQSFYVCQVQPHQAFCDI
ncbi:MAG: hypothetical protein HUJ51_03775 [Eggerthellaceae bacterium]|nr:hypothetical protein [Eggerthellaceae bacterium]